MPSIHHCAPSGLSVPALNCCSALAAFLILNNSWYVQYLYTEYTFDCYPDAQPIAAFLHICPGPIILPHTEKSDYITKSCNITELPGKSCWGAGFSLAGLYHALQDYNL